MSIATSSAVSPNGHTAAASDLHLGFQSLADRIRSSLEGTVSGTHVIGVTSCHHGEGVSTVAANLAWCGVDAYDGAVLLVDAHPQRSTLASRFDLPESPGLTDLLLGNAKPLECVRRVGDSRLRLLPAGKQQPGAPTISSDRGRHVLTELRSNFRLIVLDLPPCGDDSPTAAQAVDGFLLVIEAESVRQQVAQRVKDDFARAGGKLLGAVLNKRRFHIPGWLYRKL